MEKNKQASIDIGGEFSRLEKQLEAGFDGKITDIVKGASAEFYGDKQQFDNKIGYILTIDLFMKGDKGESIKFDTFETFLPKPKPQFLKKSKLGAYKEQYGKYPDINDEIRIFVDDNGFYQIEGAQVDIEEN